ncbi:MAG: MscL family protein [Candidatus Paceibacterota bacterium]
MKRLQNLKKIRGFAGFKDFLENQGIITLAIGFILGGAISKFVSSLVVDIINPVLNGLLGGVDDLNSKVVHLNKATIHYGVFINNGIDFIVIAIVIYVGVRLFKMDQEKIGKMDVGKINSLNTTPKK